MMTTLCPCPSELGVSGVILEVLFERNTKRTPAILGYPYSETHLTGLIDVMVCLFLLGVVLKGFMALGLSLLRRSLQM